MYPSKTGPQRSVKSSTPSAQSSDIPKEAEKDAYLPVGFGRRLLSLDSDSIPICGYNFSAVKTTWAHYYPNQSPLDYRHVYFFYLLPGHNWFLCVLFPQQKTIEILDPQTTTWTAGYRVVLSATYNWLHEETGQPLAGWKLVCNRKGIPQQADGEVNKNSGVFSLAFLYYLHFEYRFNTIKPAYVNNWRLHYLYILSKELSRSTACKISATGVGSFFASSKVTTPTGTDGYTPRLPEISMGNVLPANVHSGPLPGEIDWDLSFQGVKDSQVLVTLNTKLHGPVSVNLSSNLNLINV